jgi:uncharacterized integral membrane protein
MLQLLVAVMLTVTAVMFAMANTHHIELNFVVGDPVEVRLIFLLLATFMAGSTVSYLHVLLTRVTRGLQRRREKRIVHRRRVLEGELE